MIMDFCCTSDLMKPNNHVHNLRILIKLPLNPFTKLKSVKGPSSFTACNNSGMQHFHLAIFRTQCALDFKIPVSLNKLPHRFLSGCVNCVLSHSVWSTRLWLTHVLQYLEFLQFLVMLEVWFRIHGPSLCTSGTVLNLQYHFKINLDPPPFCAVANYQKWYYGVTC